MHPLKAVSSMVQMVSVSEVQDLGTQGVQLLLTLTRCQELTVPTLQGLTEQFSLSQHLLRCQQLLLHILCHCDHMLALCPVQCLCSKGLSLFT